MDKTAVRNFAVNARLTLLAAVRQRAFEYEITENGTNDTTLEHVGGHLLTPAEQEQRKQLISRIQQNGFAQTMEEAAYTWFNRLIALRFMEVNGYLPSRIRVFSDENGAFKPEILSEALNIEMDGLNREHILELLEHQNNEALYKYLLITQCNALNKELPEMFEKIGGWTELLFPNHLLRHDSVIAHMVEDIPEQDWTEQVQIIGWMYQYYNTEQKDRVFDDLKKNIRISAAHIPAATQLFTPDWIVRYMVDNSLGRLWLEAHPDSSVREYLDYYLAGVQKTSQMLAPEQIRVIDPCMGSGHILVYAFDLLMQIYTSCGWSERDAAKSILTNNLYGLDIDRRAYQLAYFAVMMKARQYHRRILSDDIMPHLANFQDVSGADTAMLPEPLKGFAEQFAFADTYGSLMELSAPEDIEETVAGYDLSSGIKPSQLAMMVRICHILSQQYDVVVTNPPYMNASHMNAKLADFIRRKFPDYRHDLFSAFMVRCTMLARPEGYLGFLTPYVWMFIQSYEKLRRYLYTDKTIETLIQFEYSAFEEATVPLCAFVIRNSYADQKGLYLRLTDFKGGMEIQRQKILEAIANPACDFCYEANAADFSKISGAPTAYWVSEHIAAIFEQCPKLNDVGLTRLGMTTGENARFVRYWFEVNRRACEFYASSQEELDATDAYYVPYNKGGNYRKWYGNNDHVLFWKDNGYAIRHFADANGRIRSTVPNTDYYFLPCVSWSKISSGKIAFRFKQHSIFDVAGACYFTKTYPLPYMLGFLNSNVVGVIISTLSPTMNYEGGQIASLPVKYDETMAETIISAVNANIALSRQDWDSFETSWDFRKYPLIEPKGGNMARLISEKFAAWQAECDERFNKLKSNEEELNRIFIDIYGLQDELTPEVEDKDVTVRKADLQREIRSLISYAVGCIFGRYSIDCEGLCYAGGAWDDSKYQTIIPVADNIMPVCDDDYFEDDLTARIIDFVRKVYGDATLEENLRFIANALGGKGTPREVIRNYLLTGFYPDHCKIYQKRPVYWMFSSGKKHGFKALVYMHRWQKDTIAKVRTDYVHELQERYRTQMQMLSEQTESAAVSDRARLKKQYSKLQAQLTEITAYEEKVHHLADRMIGIDLDDGVKVNYAKFTDVLEKIR